MSGQQAETIQQPQVKEVTLKRDLGVFGSFSIGFADVGADIYVALGLVLFFAMGVAPLALAVAALGYIFTALSYAELASAIPMAGGASVFSREAFNDFWAFIAGWGLLLDYTIDIALFGWITMGYLGSFCQNLSNTGVPYIGALSGLNALNTVTMAGMTPNYSMQAIATIILCLLLLGLNYIGIRESANFNIVLSCLSILSETALLLIGFGLAWNYQTFVHSITQLGTGVSIQNFGWGITVAMVSFIGLESVSQSAEETKRPDKTIPKATFALIISVIVAGMLLCILAVGLPNLSPNVIGTIYQNDPVAGVAKGIGMSLSQSNPLVTLLPLWVGFMGFIMVLMSTNTGVIGASRVTYSMSRYKIMPGWFSHIDSKYRVPTRTIVVFTLASIGFVLFVWIMGTYRISNEDPTIILGDLYNYGALVSFMLVNLALIKLRNSRPDLYRPYKSPLSFHIKVSDKQFKLLIMPVLGVLGIVILWLSIFKFNLVNEFYGGFFLIVGIVAFYLVSRVKLSGQRSEIPVLPLLGFFVCASVWVLVLSLHQIGKIVGTLWFIAGIGMYLYYRRRMKINWRDPIPGTRVTHPDVAHNLHPEIAEELKNTYYANKK